MIIDFTKLFCDIIKNEDRAKHETYYFEKLENGSCYIGTNTFFAGCIVPLLDFDKFEYAKPLTYSKIVNSYNEMTTNKFWVYSHTIIKDKDHIHVYESDGIKAYINAKCFKYLDDTPTGIYGCNEKSLFSVLDQTYYFLPTILKND